MALIFSNNALSKLAQALSSGQTQLTLQAGTGALFPSPSGGDYFKLTVEDRRTQQIEIMHCTGRSGDVLTVVRAREDMTAENFLVGATVSNRFTRDTPAAILEEVPNANPLYLGAFATAPLTDNNGDPLQTGMFYFDTSLSKLFFWTGASWLDPIGSSTLTSASGMFMLVDVSGDFDGVETEFDLRYTDYAAMTQTPDVTIAEQFIVFLDGVPQQPGVDYTIPVLGTIEFAEPPAADVLFHGVWVALQRFEITTQTANITAGVLTLDFVAGDAAEVLLDENVTSIVVSNWFAAGVLSKMTLFIRQDPTGGRTVAFPVGWRWVGGAVPSITSTADKVDICVIMSIDGGTTIFATLAGQNY